MSDDPRIPQGPGTDTGKATTVRLSDGRIVSVRIPSLRDSLPLLEAISALGDKTIFGDWGAVLLFIEATTDLSREEAAALDAVDGLKILRESGNVLATLLEFRG